MEIPNDIKSNEHSHGPGNEDGFGQFEFVLKHKGAFGSSVEGFKLTVTRLDGSSSLRPLWRTLLQCALRPSALA